MVQGRKPYGPPEDDEGKRNRKRSNMIRLVEDDGGRAWKEYDTEYCFVVRELAQRGMFPEEWCARLGITTQTLFYWANTHPEFEMAIREAWVMLAAQYTAHLRNVILKPTLWADTKTTALLLLLKTRFPEIYDPKKARFTADAFERRNDVVTDADGKAATINGTPVDSVEMDELDRRIAELEARSAEFRTK